MAGTDTGLLLVIDPCQLFTDEEWGEIPFAEEGAIEAAIEKKFTTRSENFDLLRTGGDGSFLVGILG